MILQLKPPRISQSTREAIIEYSENYSLREIAKLTNCDYCTVRNVLRSFKNQDIPPKRVGRRRLLTASDDRHIKLIAKRNSRKTLPETANEFNIGKATILSNATIRRSLKRNDLNGRVALKKPLLRKENIKKRYKFAIDHINWTTAQWDRVLWCDESKFENFGNK